MTEPGHHSYKEKHTCTGLAIRRQRQIPVRRTRADVLALVGGQTQVGTAALRFLHTRVEG